MSGASANILRNRSFQNLRSAEAAITGSVYLDTKCCHMWRLEGCHDVSFNCTARELSNCFRTSRTSSLVRISTCRHSHVCIILRWKVGFFVLWHAFFKCSLGERINKKMNEKFVAILLRYREQPRPCIYLSISFYIYIYVHIFIRGRKPSLNAATDVNRKVLRWAS